MIAVLSRLEHALVGPCPPDVRRNMRVELAASLAYGPFHAALLFIPVVLQRLGAGPELIALYQSASYIGFFLVPFTARFIPERGVQHFLAWLWAIGRGFLGAMGLAMSAPVMLLLSVAVYFFESSPSPAYTRVIQAIYPAAMRGRALGYVRLGLATGMLAATPVSGWILDTLGYAALFPVAGALGVMSAWVFSRIRIVESRAPTQAGRSLRELWSVLRHDRRYQFYLLSVAAFGFGGLLPSAFFPSVIVDRLNLSYTSVSLLGGTQSIMWLIGYLIWGQFFDRFTGMPVLRVLYALMAVIPLSYLVADSAWMLLPAFIAQGLGSAGIDLAFQNCTIELSRGDRTYEYAALLRTVIGVRGLIGPLLGVWLAQLGVATAAIFIIGALLYLAATLCVMHPLFRAPAVSPKATP